MRPDYCPIGNEPCQSLCDKPCNRTPQRKPLTHEQRLDVMTEFEKHRMKWDDISVLIDMVEAAHGIKE